MTSKTLAPAVLHEEPPAYMRHLLRSGARFAEGNTGEGDGGADTATKPGDAQDKGAAAESGKGRQTNGQKPGDTKTTDDGKPGDQDGKPDAKDSDLQKQLDDALAKLQKIEDAKLTDDQRKDKKAKEDAEELVRLRQENERLTLMSEHDIPAKYKTLISGTTTEEREANALLVAELIKAGATGPEKKDDKDAKKPGVVPGSGTGGDSDTASITSGAELYRKNHPKKVKE